MAKRRRSTALATYTPPPRAAAPVIVMSSAPRGVARRRSSSVGRPRHKNKRGGHKSPQFTTNMAIPAVVGAAAVGWIGAKGYLAKLPEIGGSRMNALGLAGYAVMRFTKHPGIRAAGFAALTVAAFNFGRLQGGGGIAGAEDVSGLEDVSGDVEGEGAEVLGDGSSNY